MSEMLALGVISHRYLLPKHNLVLTDTLRVSAFSKRLLEIGYREREYNGDVLQAGNWRKDFSQIKGYMS